MTARAASRSLATATWAPTAACAGSRSEERRVGEEGRSRGAPYHLKKKNKVVKYSIENNDPVRTETPGARQKQMIIQTRHRYNAISKMRSHHHSCETDEQTSRKIVDHR